MILVKVHRGIIAQTVFVQKEYINTPQWFFLQQWWKIPVVFLATGSFTINYNAHALILQPSILLSEKLGFGLIILY